MDSSLYVHLPFCRKRCTYCAFAISTDQRLESAYVDALVREITLRGAGEALETIYFGGGTPSRMSETSLRRLFEAIGNAFSATKTVEVTLEANPEDVTAGFIDLVRALGVTRLSLGVQSLNDRELYPLGRGHAASESLSAVELALAASLRVSADLILGLPKQTIESYRRSLRQLLERGVPHISIYMLDLEEQTPLERQVATGRAVLPDDEHVAALYLETVSLVQAHGLRQYEISNFARPGEESRHNLRYWRREPYIGVGVGAHSFASGQRTANTREVEEYIRMMNDRGSATVFTETLTVQEVAHEELFLSLRQAAGIEYSDLAAKCGEEGIQWARRGFSEGWLAERDGRVSFTPRGFLLSNEYISQLF